MALLRSVVPEDHSVDHSTLVLTCAQAEDGDRRLEVDPEADSLIGSFALAGDGWLYAEAYSGDLPLRLEAHDGPPPLPGPAPADVVRSVLETPMLGAGPVSSTGLVDGAPSAELDVGRAAGGAGRVSL